MQISFYLIYRFTALKPISNISTGAGCDIIATSTSSNTPFLIRTIFPPPPSSAGVPMTDNWSYREHIHIDYIAYKSLITNYMYMYQLCRKCVKFRLLIYFFSHKRTSNVGSVDNTVFSPLAISFYFHDHTICISTFIYFLPVIARIAHSMLMINVESLQI